jgi:hypothetical protein
MSPLAADSNLEPKKEWQGYVNLVGALGSSTGAPLGGLLADTVG